MVDDIAVAVSYLNAARSLAQMNGDSGTFSDALMQAVDLSHLDDRGFVGRILGRLAGGTEALRVFAAR